MATYLKAIHVDDTFELSSTCCSVEQLSSGRGMREGGPGARENSSLFDASFQDLLHLPEKVAVPLCVYLPGNKIQGGSKKPSNGISLKGRHI